MPLVRATAAAGLVGPLPPTPDGAPIIVMVHGYRFSPTDPAHDPFTHILAPARARPGKGALPWPRHLGFGRGDPMEGLGVGFAWEARGSFWRARREAARAGEALAEVVEGLRAALPGRPVHVVAHSLGARVALRAMRRLPEGALGRVVLLSPAEHRGAARLAMASPAGRRAEVISVRSAENRAFDALLQLLVPWPDPVVGLGLAGLPNWLDLDPCDPRVRERAARLGHPIAARRWRVCHHSSYARPGLMRLYRAFLREPARLPLSALRVDPSPALAAAAPDPTMSLPA